MDNDDRQIGRILSRREALALLGAAGGALLIARAAETFGSTTPSVSAQAAPTVATTPMSYLPLVVGPDATPTTTPGTVPACVVRPEVTEGPYFVYEGLNRSDIRSDPGTGVIIDGALLLLTFNVSQIAGSGCAPLAAAQVDVWHCDATGLYSDEAALNTSGQKFLRGYQVTDTNGIAAFTTIYPGGTTEGRSIFTSRFARPRRPIRAMSSPRSYSSTTRSRIRCLPSNPTRPRGSATR